MPGICQRVYETSDRVVDIVTPGALINHSDVRGHRCLFEHAQKELLEVVRGQRSTGGAAHENPNSLCPPEWLLDTDDESYWIPTGPSLQLLGDFTHSFATVW